MNIKHLVALAVASSAFALSGSVLAADAEKSDQTDRPKAEKPAKKKVKPHSHPRDAKGMSVPDKTEKGGAPTSGAEEKTMKPHDHMRDAK